MFGVGETMVIVKSLSCLPVARGTATAKITAAAGAKAAARAAAAAPATPPAATATAVLAAMTYDGHGAPGEDPGVEQGRDGCRVPLPWKAGTPTFGFSPATKVTFTSLA